MRTRWALLTDDKEDLYKYLYYISVQYIRRIGDDQNRKLREILYMEEGREQMEAFGTYLGNAENLKRFQKIFPSLPPPVYLPIGWDVGTLLRYDGHGRGKPV